MKPIFRKFVNLTLTTAIAGVCLVSPVMAADVHKVRSGESLWSIARAYHVDVNTLAKINNIRDISMIREGMELKLQEAPKTYRISQGETLWSVSRKFGVNYQELLKVNNLKNPDRILVGTEIRIPETGSGTTVREQRFIWPLKGRISSKFGPRWGKKHEGIDISVPIGQKIVAAASGKVVLGGWVTGYGYTVIIEHAGGYRTLYAHNSKLLVAGGDRVQQGDLIAISGNSGRSTGPHLHFEIQKDGRPMDPLGYLK